MENTRIFTGIIAGVEHVDSLFSIIKLYDIYDTLNRGPINLRFYFYVPKLCEGRAVDIIETSFISERSRRVEALEQELIGVDFTIRIKIGADLIDRILASR